MSEVIIRISCFVDFFTAAYIPKVKQVPTSTHVIVHILKVIQLRILCVCSFLYVYICVVC